MFSFHSSYSWMRGKREAWNWPFSRQDASPSSWTILACVGLNATFRAFHTLQDGPSLSREGIPGGLKEQRFGDQAQTFWKWTTDPDQKWHYVWVEVPHLCQLFADHFPWIDIPGTSWPLFIKHKGQFWNEGTKLWDSWKNSSLRGNRGSFSLCFFSPMFEKLGPE